MEIIATELAKRGQPASVIEKVLGANFQRVIGEIWGRQRIRLSASLAPVSAITKSGRVTPSLQAARLRVNS